ncbi:minor tail protein [Microbacterium phage YellowPanda]
MAEWDHRAATGNGAYQLYLYVVETAFVNTDRGQTGINWELGLIKVASSNGFASNDSSVPWEVHMHGSGGGNGDISGTSSFSFGANDPIGTRKILANGNALGWGFHHNTDYTGRLYVNTMARITVDGTIGSPQIGWGNVEFTRFFRDATPPANLAYLGRQSDTAFTVRAFNSTDWGLGDSQVLHRVDRSEVSNMATLLQGYDYPTTGGGQAHSIAVTGMPAHKSQYLRPAVRGRTGNWMRAGIMEVNARPSKPPKPEVASKTTTSITVSTANPSYVGGGLTSRETQISKDNFATILDTKTGMSSSSFTGLTRVTAYKIRTRVVNVDGTSDWSDTLDVTTTGAPPSAPSGYVAYDIASTSAKVSIGSISDNGGAVPSRARVKVSTTASDTGLIKTVETASWSPTRITGLTKNTQYYVSEAAYNSVEGGGWGAYGSWVPLKTLNNVPNGPILSLDSAAGTFVTLKWTVPSDLAGATITNYRLRVGSNDALTTNVQEFTVPADTLAQVVTGLTAATSYWAEVWTETDNGRGSGSALLNFTTTGGSGSTSGIWLRQANGTPIFCEVWWRDASGVPRLCEPWIRDSSGIPRLGTQ